jgi:phosphoribosyl 1,2-cyclic phosphate phosphodiesterase
MIGKFVFLGTGGSTGVPVIGCKCPVCTSPSSSNQRLRTSAYLKVEGRSLLIDAGPDFRQQALRYHIDHLDGLLLTHVHFDHVAGIDELRIYCLRQKKPFPCLLSLESLTELKRRYPYLFEPTASGLQLEVHPLQGNAGEIDFLGVKIGYCSYFQGGMKVTGFRIGHFAYISDIKEYDASIFTSLRGVKKLVVSALFEESSVNHLSLSQAIDFARNVGSSETWITHISHKMDHDLVSSKLPSDVKLGIDGMEIEFEY